MSSTSILFFGDQTVDAGPFLKTLVQQSKFSPALDRFLKEALRSLKMVVSNLPSHEQKKFLPPAGFHSILDLVGDCGEGGIMLSTVLQCLAQLGDYIWQVPCTQDIPTKRDVANRSRKQTCRAGSSTCRRRNDQSIAAYCCWFLHRSSPCRCGCRWDHQSPRFHLHRLPSHNGIPPACSVC